MKIRAIRLENVRRFVSPVEIAGIGDGLNVLTAPNERGNRRSSMHYMPSFSKIEDPGTGRSEVLFPMREGIRL